MSEAIHEALLRTAVLPEDIPADRSPLLGYRPRPGIGATGVVAALTDSSRPFVLAQGFAIQGPSDPGKPPQVFELDEDIEIGLLGRPLPASARLPSAPDPGSTPSGVPSKNVVGAWSGYAARDAAGRLRNSVPAREKKDPSFRMKAGTPLTVAVNGVVTLVKPDDTVLFLKRD